jgi:hypothetical protein
MKTAKGSTYKSLLAVKVEQGTLYTGLEVPMSLGDIAQDYIDKVVTFVDERIQSEKKPAATLERCITQIELHRTHLIKAYVELFECYKYCTNPQVRQSPTDKVQMSMLESMPDAMLSSFAKLYLSSDRMLDVILPDDRDTLIDEVVVAMKAAMKEVK